MQLRHLRQPQDPCMGSVEDGDRPVHHVPLEGQLTIAHALVLAVRDRTMSQLAEVGRATRFTGPPFPSRGCITMKTPRGGRDSLRSRSVADFRSQAC